MFFFNTYITFCLVQSDWMWCSFECSYRSFAFTIPRLSLFPLLIIHSYLYIERALVLLDGWRLSYDGLNNNTIFVIVVEVQIYSACPKVIFISIKSLLTVFNTTFKIRWNIGLLWIYFTKCFSIYRLCELKKKTIF